MNETSKHSWTVSILCLTYNQKDFVRDCLDGIVRQQASFPFRAIVHDDASADGTTGIIREYAERYPDLIIPIFEKTNQFSQNAFGEILRQVSPYLEQGKYLAICEGDDYWTDTLKLQRQVDFMEAHPDYALCYHDVMDLHLETGEQRLFDYYGKTVPDDADIHDLCQLDLYVRTCSTLYRTSAIDFEQLCSVMPVINLDSLMLYQAACHGRLKRLPQTMATYRIGPGVWSSLRQHDPRRVANTIKTISVIQTMMPTPELRAAISHTMEWHIQDWTQYEAEQQRYIHALETSRARRLGLVLLAPLNWAKRLLHL